MNQKDTSKSLSPQESDILSIPRVLETVRVRGEVLYSGPMRYDAADTFKEYISQAGGFSDNARLSKAYVVYANGSAERTRRFLFFRNYPEVRPGAEIIVPQKPPRNRISAAEIIGITSAIATMSLVVDRLIN